MDDRVPRDEKELAAMVHLIHKLLAHPGLYYRARHWVLGGLPFSNWVGMYGLNQPDLRIGDLGCGPADILRHIPAKARPAFYLGVDFDEEYLRRAERRGRQLGLNAAFVNLDLRKLATDCQVQDQLRQILTQHRIGRVLLLGVIHHIDDPVVISTLNLLHSIVTVQSVVTQDVIMLPYNGLNNSLARRDRGQYVRTQEQYETLIAKTLWPIREIKWSRPGIRSIRYIHFDLRRV